MSPSKITYALLEIPGAQVERTRDSFIDGRADDAHQEVEEGQPDEHVEDRITTDVQHRPGRYFLPAYCVNGHDEALVTTRLRALAP